ncbi:TPA: TniQ family protein [Pseudomonas putida]|nr:TniQ family protein [Pseudomonas putida]
MDNLSSTPLPKPDESPISLFYRCCKNNGFQTPNQLIRNQRLRFSGFAQAYCKGQRFFEFIVGQKILLDSEKDIIANTFFEPTLKGHESGLTYKGLFFPAKFVRGQLALCPSCVREGFLHNMHLFSWSDVCPQHGEKYITACPQCHDPLPWAELRDYHCLCGFDLRDTVSSPSQDPFHEILNHAVATEDPAFFAIACELLSAFEYFRTPRNAPTLTRACYKIALGGAVNFFESIASLQRLYPSLHRIAFIAPLIRISDEDIRNHALEYLYKINQSIPRSHPKNCDCHELRYTLESAQFLIKGNKNLAHLVSEQHIKFDWTMVKYYKKKLLRSDNLCKMLIAHSETTWENNNSMPQPEVNFKLVNLNEARQKLKLTSADAITLTQAGKIKTLRLTLRTSALVSRSEIDSFAANFATLTNIRKSCTLPPSEIKAYLREIPCERISINFRPTISLYLRSLLPEAILLDLDRRDQRMQSSEAVMNFEDASTVLKVDPKDIRMLIGLGVIECKTRINSSRQKGRVMCLASSMQTAQKWKNGHLTVSETAELAGCSQKMITTTYLKPGFVPYLKLRTVTLILKTDAERIIEHIQKYITMTATMSKYRFNNVIMARFIDADQLHPLRSDHPDFIKGSVTFVRNEVKTVLENNHSKHIGVDRVSRIHNKFRPI